VQFISAFRPPDGRHRQAIANRLPWVGAATYKLAGGIDAGT
jgi:hypothetical protein